MITLSCAINIENKEGDLDGDMQVVLPKQWKAAHIVSNRQIILGRSSKRNLPI